MKCRATVGMRVMLLLPALFVFGHPAHAQTNWEAWTATEVMGNCPSDAVAFCVTAQSPYPGCSGATEDLSLVSFPLYRDQGVGCTMSELIPEGASTNEGTYWHLCVGDCPEGFLKYEAVGWTTEVEGLDCGDLLDDDGDGRINEEWPNGLDDDQDGLVDEDLRCEIVLIEELAVPIQKTTWGMLKVRY